MLQKLGSIEVSMALRLEIMVKHFEIRPTVQKLGMIEVSRALRLKTTVKRSKIVVPML